MTSKTKAAAGAQAASDTADRQANPTERSIDMQACRELFAALAADNLATAALLSSEIGHAGDDFEKRRLGARILNALRMSFRFKAGAMRADPQVEGC